VSGMSANLSVDAIADKNAGEHRYGTVPDGITVQTFEITDLEFSGKTIGVRRGIVGDNQRWCSVCMCMGSQ